MAVITTTSDLDSLIQVVVGEAKYTFRHTPIMRQCVDVFEFPEHKGGPIDYPKFGKLTAYGLTEGTDMGYQAWSDSDVSITPAEVGLCVPVSRMTMRRAPAMLGRMLTDECNRAVATKLDTDLLSLLDGFSTSKGSAGSALTVAILEQAIQLVKHNSTEPGPPPYFIVLHGYQAYDIIAAMGVAGTYPVPQGPSASVLQNLLGGRFLGCTFYEDSNITVDSDDDAKGGDFSKLAIKLCVVVEPKLEIERDASLRADEFNLVMEYGYGEWSDSMGVEIYTDAATPA